MLASTRTASAPAAASRLLPFRPRLAGSRLADQRLIGRLLAGPLLACLTVACLLLPAPAALAGTPATVTVRVLGPASSYESLTPPTVVTTTAAPVTKYGGSCSGTSAGGALELATKGDWEGTWNTEFNDYEVIGIDGRSFPFEQGSPADYYWSFWLNNVYEEAGICEVELEAGDQVLFVPSCYGVSCPPAATQLLSVEAPATAEVGEPVTVTVRSYPAAGGASSVAAGVTVGDGDTSARTNSEGHATLAFSEDGTYTVRASGASGEEPMAVPGEATVCAHQGNDGTCGTPSASVSGGPTIEPPASETSQGNFYTGPYPLVADVTGVLDGHVYSARNAPRELSGTVTSHASVTSISLRLRRTYRGRCWAYDGSSERLQPVRCRRGSFFKIASGGDSFSYLLPSRLPPGRYVLDVGATDSSGRSAPLDRGSSRVVFYVK
jgi:hypothetical protein